MSKLNYTILLTIILLIGGFLLFYRLSELMTFIGDQGWYYLSARDMMLSGHIPLVGISASHTWLHQGALFTYFLGLVFSLTHFAPLAPGYATAFGGLLTIFFISQFARHYFSPRVGLIVGLFYATSPLMIISARMPYHTTFIPLLIVFFLFAFMQWLEGKPQFFPIVIFCLALLYNLELATVPLWTTPIIFFVYGYLKKRSWVKKTLTIKLFLLSTLAFIFPMFPMIIYDSTHGFPQTVRFLVWIGYKAATAFGFPAIHPTPYISLSSFAFFSLREFQQLIFLSNTIVATFLLISMLFFACYIVSMYLQRKLFSSAYVLVSIVFLIALLGYLVARTPSEAYFPMMFPTGILLLALMVDKLYCRSKTLFLAVVIIVFLPLLNTLALFDANYLTGRGQGITFTQRLSIAKEIVAKSQQRRYTIQGKGEGSQFASFTMNYQYLTWWLGHGSTFKNPELIFTITESRDTVSVKEEKR